MVLGYMLKSLLQRIRTVFLAGLLVTLPLAVTVWVIVTMVAFVDGVTSFIPRVLPQSVFEWIQSFYQGFPVNDAGLPQGLGILVALVTLFVVGVLARSYVGGRLIGLYEWMLGRVPVASSIYNAVKELLELVFSQDGNAFEKVVLVEWPRPGLYSIGFLNGTAWVQVEGAPRLVNVFLPTTPNPTTGFFAMVPEDQVIVTEMTVEQGFKILMSAGLVAPDAPFQVTAESLSALGHSVKPLRERP
ncbi:MAG: DUF502 domain-containing protein [Myxococcota bacterium]